MVKNRLYEDLAWLWPLWEDVEKYRDECKFFADLIKTYSTNDVHTLLDIGCGGGKHAFHMKNYFKVTGIDISEAMLANARKLNPECEFCIADMRKFDLQRKFDAVFINDSITYMTSEQDLLSVFHSAYKHLKGGGVLITWPDIYKEMFSQNFTNISTSGPPGNEITFIENSYDPDPDDNTYELTLIFLIRKNGHLRIERDFHTCGIFSLDTWRSKLKQAGFKYQEKKWPGHKNESPVFVCIKAE